MFAWFKYTSLSGTKKKRGGSIVCFSNTPHENRDLLWNMGKSTILGVAREVSQHVFHPRKYRTEYTDPCFMM